MDRWDSRREDMAAAVAHTLLAHGILRSLAYCRGGRNRCSCRPEEVDPHEPETT
jgi:hypothetical protein